MGGPLDLIGGLLSPIQTLISGPKKAKAIPPPPPPPPPPAPPPPMPIPDDAAVKIAARRKLATTGGRQSTILSNVGGIGQSDTLGG